MMYLRTTLVGLCLLVCVSCASGARVLVQQQDSSSCDRIPNCLQCYAAKNEASETVQLCRTCANGYRPTADTQGCECAPGYYAAAGSSPSASNCVVCPKGSWCTGSTAAPQQCGDGLTTLTEAVRSNNLCVTLPGYGLRRTRVLDSAGNVATAVSASPCPQDSYNPGSNSLACRRCPAGLVTLITGAVAAKDCLAGPGYLFDKLTAKPCPRGTYKNNTSKATACTKCPSGLTTAAVQSTQVTDCIQALPGFYLPPSSSAAGAAVFKRASAAAAVVAGASSAVRVAATADGSPDPGIACPIGSYNEGFNDAIQCTPCSENMVTLSTGSRSEASCVAPPGYGWDTNTSPQAQPCAIGFFKEGYNRRLCTSCGAGWLTDSTGTTSRAGCVIPAGFGTFQRGQDDGTTLTTVEKCLSGLFGFANKTYGMSSQPCRSCPTGMATQDANQGLSAADRAAVLNTSPSDCWTLPGWGYDTQAQTAKLCMAGAWSAGWSKEPCVRCPEGYTTARDGSTSAAECVIAPGWHLDTRVSAKPMPCDLGSFCPGMTLTAGAVPCPTGTTNARQMAKAPADCDVCTGGYGSWVAPSAATGDLPSCTLCPADTYSPSGSRSACISCPAGTVAKAGSDSMSDCQDQWAVLNKDFDYLPVADVSLLVQQQGVFGREADCQATCSDDACTFYSWDAFSKSCHLYLAPQGPAAVPNMQLGLKVDVGVYSVFPANAASKGIGLKMTLLADPVRGKTVQDCERECDAAEACVAVIVTKTSLNSVTCNLRQGDIAQDKRSKYRVTGAKIDNWMFPV